MDFFAECAMAASLLPKFEPIAGAGLAINLAYLCLERFRYRSKIRLHARHELERLKGYEQTVLNAHPWYRQVTSFAQLPNNDPEDIKAPKKKKKIKMPDGYWGKIYVYVFSIHQDRASSCIFLIGSVIALIIGTAHSVEYLEWNNCIFSGALATFWFYFLSAAIIGPIWFVYCGGRMVRWGKQCATDIVEGIELLLQESVEAAPIPVVEDLKI